MVRMSRRAMTLRNVHYLHEGAGKIKGLVTFVLLGVGVCNFFYEKKGVIFFNRAAPCIFFCDPHHDCGDPPAHFWTTPICIFLGDPFDDDHILMLSCID